MSPMHEQKLNKVGRYVCVIRSTIAAQAEEEEEAIQKEKYRSKDAF